MALSRHFKGIWIPREIWLHKNISLQAKNLWAEIHSLYDEDHGGCYADNEYLCDFLGLKLRRLQEVIKELKDNKLLIQISFNGRQRVLKALNPPVETKEERTSEMRKSAHQGCRKVHPSGAESCATTIYKSKSKNKIKNPPTPQKGESAGDFADSFEEDSQDEKEEYGPDGLVKLTMKQYETLLKLPWGHKIDEMIEELALYIGSTGKRYKSHFYTLQDWHARKQKEKKEKTQGSKRDGSSLKFEKDSDTWTPEGWEED